MHRETLGLLHLDVCKCLASLTHEDRRRPTTIGVAHTSSASLQNGDVTESIVFACPKGCIFTRLLAVRSVAL